MDVTRRSRTPREDTRIVHSDSLTRLLVKIVRDVNAAERPDSYADLKPSVRKKLRALKVRYRQCDLDRAIDLVAASGRLLARPVVRGSLRGGTALVVIDEVGPPLTRAQAVDLLARVGARVRSL